MKFVHLPGGCMSDQACLKLYFYLKYSFSGSGLGAGAELLNIRGSNTTWKMEERDVYKSLAIYGYLRPGACI